jgi:hypothetical protein
VTRVRESYTAQSGPEGPLSHLLFPERAVWEGQCLPCSAWPPGVALLSGKDIQPPWSLLGVRSLASLA